MNLRTQIASLRQEAELAVADVLLQLLNTNCLDTIKDYCFNLRPLNSLPHITNLVFDKLAQTKENEKAWNAAYSLLISECTRSLKIKPTWSAGEYLHWKLKDLKHLHTLDVSGKYLLSLYQNTLSNTN